MVSRRGIWIEWLVGSWIYALTDQLLAQVSVPVVLYLIVCTPRNPPSYQRPSTVTTVGYIHRSSHSIGKH
ncbi:hypothetical protein RchiOBHm_Chr5g0083241 [Rosa chinensis]|uniref:Uncharacterized protein n=1 Tax=Rosa chinensis TaxID=74649 RepID=A0A2P6QNH3_ROSCH|nr:hypothetical protein RchiOBHm_Chr5g0083241 [Rosa chinensis]